MRFQAIAFDVDGTLYPNAAMYRRSVSFALKNFSLLRAFSRARSEIREVRPVEDFKLLQAELVARELGSSPEHAAELIEHTMYVEWEKVLHQVPLFHGVKDLLSRLKSAGALLAVASDFPVKTKMGILGLDNFWDFELATEDTNYLKPNPEPFLEISRRFKLPPEQILYVGNSYEYDVLGAKGVGMAAAHLARFKPRKSLADFTFSSYKDLADYLFR